MTIWGMDVEAVERVAKSLADRSNDLSLVVSTLDRVVNELSSVWYGKDSSEFTSQLWPQHKRALLAVVAEIEGLSQTVRGNVTDQNQASTSVGSASGSGGFNLGSIFDSISNFLDTKTLIHGWRIGDIAGNVSGLGSLVNSYTAIDGIRSGDGGAVAASLVNGAASALKANKTNPVSYLSGVILSEGVVIAEQAQKIDWSAQAMADTFSYVASNPADAISTATKELVSAVPKIISVFR